MASDLLYLNIWYVAYTECYGNAAARMLFLTRFYPAGLLYTLKYQVTIVLSKQLNCKVSSVHQIDLAEWK